MSTFSGSRRVRLLILTIAMLLEKSQSLKCPMSFFLPYDLDLPPRERHDYFWESVLWLPCCTKITVFSGRRRRINFDFVSRIYVFNLPKAGSCLQYLYLAISYYSILRNGLKKELLKNIWILKHQGHPKC